MTLQHTTARRTRFRLALLSYIILFTLFLPGTTFAHYPAPRRRKHARRATLNRQQAKPAEEAAATGLKTYALRLRPGQDLRVELEKLTRRRGIRAGFILTAVGSLQKASLRLANQNSPTSFEDKFEIVSLVGTLSPDGPHLHLSLADATGRTIGGHLVEGSIVYTTAEIVVGELKGVRFTREQDEQTGYKELHIRRR
jgi:predicted DNA-binding protein with PD1-like motif